MVHNGSEPKQWSLNHPPIELELGTSREGPATMTLPQDKDLGTLGMAGTRGVPGLEARPPPQGQTHSVTPKAQMNAPFLGLTWRDPVKPWVNPPFQPRWGCLPSHYKYPHHWQVLSHSEYSLNHSCAHIKD